MQYDVLCISCTIFVLKHTVFVFLMDTKVTNIKIGLENVIMLRSVWHLNHSSNIEVSHALKRFDRKWCLNCSGIIINPLSLFQLVNFVKSFFVIAIEIHDIATRIIDSKITEKISNFSILDELVLTAHIWINAALN
jgi:hypothetical protein